MNIKKLKINVAKKLLEVGLSCTTAFTGAYSFECGTAISAFAQDPLKKNILTQEDVQNLMQDPNIFDGKVFKIPDGITEIEEKAFNGCIDLIQIIIPEGVTKIGEKAFSFCMNLTQINIPNSVTEIQYGTFSTCDSLTQIRIPSSVTKIGPSAFEGCTMLTTAILPKNIKEILERAFIHCSNLEHILFDSENETIVQKSLSDNSIDLKKVTIPANIGNLGPCCFYNCAFKAIEFLGEEVVLGTHCLSDCQNLKLASFPNAKKVEITFPNFQYDKDLFPNFSIEYILFMPAGCTIINNEDPDILG